MAATNVEARRVVVSAMQDRIDRLHKAGAERHSAVWFEANRAAVNVAWSHGIDPSKLENKYFMAEMVLRILDTTK